MPHLPASHQLADGLNVRGLTDVVRGTKCRTTFENLLVHGNKIITCDIFMEILEPKFSTDGSNRFTKEKELYQQLIEYIEFVSYDGKCYFL